MYVPIGALQCCLEFRTQMKPKSCGSQKEMRHIATFNAETTITTRRTKRRGSRKRIWKRKQKKKEKEEKRRYNDTGSSITASKRGNARCLYAALSTSLTVSAVVIGRDDRRS